MIRNFKKCASNKIQNSKVADTQLIIRKFKNSVSFKNQKQETTSTEECFIIQ